ncbi:MAG: hypothetical protein JXJ20_09450 [Anaerolineae bacterium]|nr:hypothetical protein [Anaerolineae bacterium]
MRQPDWEALSDLQFLLYNRIADSLNAALSAIALSDMPEAQNEPPGFWKDRAAIKIANVLNLFMAWSYLIRFKLGETVPERAIRPFQVNTLLAWLASQIQLNEPPVIKSNPVLHANQETLQEALLLLYSAAFTQGTGVRLELNSISQGVWFRIQFSRLKPLPVTLDDLIESFGDHWRANSTRFELVTARDFIMLNGSDLLLNSSDKRGEFAFFVKREGVRVTEAPIVSMTKSAEAADESQVTDSADTPQITEAATGDETPLLVECLPDDKPEPPTLDILRPWPGAAIPRISSPAPRTPTAPAAEGEAPPVEPDESTIPAHSADTSASAATPVSSQSTDAAGPQAADLPQPGAAPLTGPSDTARTSPTDTSPLIVPVKIPAPKPPGSMRTPPASTSNVALTRETQTLRPVQVPDTDSMPAVAENTTIPTPESELSDTASAGESSKRKDSAP